MSVAVSLTAPQFSSTFHPVLEAAESAESLGFDGLFLFDHLVPTDDPHRPVLELSSTLGAVAAITSRIVIGSLVMRAPLRGPGLSAAVSTTLGSIAPGRVIIGLGAGDAMSGPEADRFGRERETLDERVGAVAATLAATQRSAVQRWVGGTHRRMLELARQADGWNAWAVDHPSLVAMATDLRSDRPDLTVSWGGSVVMGRDGDDLDEILAERNGRGGTITGTIAEVISELGRLTDAGVDHLVLSVLPNRRRRWEVFAESVLEEVR